MLLLPLLLLADAPPLEFRRGDDPTRIEVVAVLSDAAVEGLPSGLVPREKGERLLVFGLVDPDRPRETTALLGTYRREKKTLVFVPRHSLTAGERYRATLETGGKSVSAEYRVPVASTPAPVVENVFPSGNVLPANQLKFYLHFSRPMRETRTIFDHIKLMDSDGKEVVEPWRRSELWSADGRRLTLWVHPGRIKRGIGPRETEGPVLEEGRSYTLVVEAVVADAAGKPLGRDFKKSFKVEGEKLTRPLPEKWKLLPAATGSRMPLAVEFPHPLDRALLDRCLEVTDPAGKTVRGRIEVGKDERSWRFHPASPWQAGEHVLIVDDDLEDLAGNTPAKLFDVDLTQPLPARPVLKLPFRPRS